MQEKRIFTIDGLRGIAVLIVFLSHTSSREMSLHQNLNFAGIGHVGVYLFFCLSAFLLGSKLFSEKFNYKSVLRFYIKRFFRIIPLYYFVLLVVIINQFYFNNYNNKYLFIKNDIKSVVQHFIMYRGDSVFWSVVVEEQFYLIVPLLAFLLLRFKKWTIAVFLIISITNFTLYTAKYLHFPFETNFIKYITTNDRSSGNYLDIFLVALIITYLFTTYKNKFEQYKKQINIASVTSFSLLIFLVLILVSKKFLIFNQPFYNFRYISLLFTCVFMLIIISVIIGNSFNKILSVKWLRLVGIYGFSIYLLHMMIFQLINHFTILPQIKFLLAAILVFLISYISYTLIEKPSIKLSHKLIKKFNLNE